jgi:hypothetical protein
VNVIGTKNRSAWEEALRLRPGTLARAYRDGADVQPLDEGGPADAGVAELMRQMDEDPAYAQWVADLVATVRGQPPGDPEAERKDTG